MSIKETLGFLSSVNNSHFHGIGWKFRMNSATSLLSNGATAGTGEPWSLKLGKNTVISTFFLLIFIFYTTTKLYLNSGKLRDRPYEDCLMGRLNTTFRAPKFVNFTFENKIQWHEMDFANSNIMFNNSTLFSHEKTYLALIFVVFSKSKVSWNILGPVGFHN